MKTIFTAALAVSALALAACDNDPPAGMNEAVEEQGGSLADGVGNDSRFAALVEEAGLTPLLEGPSPYTILVPSDDALAALDDVDFGQGEARKEALGELLSAHILPGTILSEDIANAITQGDGEAVLPNMAGGSITARQADGATILTLADGEEVTVTAADERYDNGVIHRIDGPLIG